MFGLFTLMAINSDPSLSGVEWAFLLPFSVLWSGVYTNCRGTGRAGEEKTEETERVGERYGGFLQKITDENRDHRCPV